MSISVEKLQAAYEDLTARVRNLETVLIKLQADGRLQSAKEPDPMIRPPSLEHMWQAHFKTWRRTVSKDRAYNVSKLWGKHVKGTDFAEQPINCCTEESTLNFLLDVKLCDDNRQMLLAIFRKLGKQAVKAGYLHYSPFADVKLPKKPKGARRPKYWDPRSEIPAIFRVSDQEQRDAFGCMYFGAMRAGDVKSLRWEHVDFDRNTVTFHEPKSGRIETIAMIPDLRTLLHTRHERRRKPQTGLVFPSPKGGEFFRTYDWHIGKVIKKAGVEKNGRKLHAFRHAAAISAASGIWGEKWSRDEVAKLLRDTSEAVNIYFDILGDAMQEKATAARSMLDEWSDAETYSAHAIGVSTSANTLCEDCTLPLS